METVTRSNEFQTKVHNTPNRIEHKNPFQIPSNNADIIRVREIERIRNEEARERNRSLKIWQKQKSLSCGGSSNNNAGNNTVNSLSHNTNLSPPETNMHSLESKQSGHKQRIGSKVFNLEEDFESSCTPPCPPMEEKEYMSTFIAKKREMFLLQMSLNIKRDEIHKIEERARLKEEALKRSELMLEEDGLRFDEFLKENDKKAQDAMRRAELETKKKIDKVQEIKRVNHVIQEVQADIGKHSEILEECMKYKIFLDQLTPAEWKEEQERKKKERKMKRRAKRIEQRKEEWRKKEEVKRNAEMERMTNILAKKKGRSKRKNNKRLTNSHSDNLVHDNNSHPMVEPDFEDEVLTSSDEDLPMYFKKPKQLLDIFSRIEEENLFLIENKQESEYAFEETKQNCLETESEMREKGAVLEGNRNDLKNSIEMEKMKANELIRKNKDDIVNPSGNMFMKLSEKVKEVYSRCGFDDSGTTPTTLFMLSELEARMGDLLLEIRELPAKVIRREMKEKEKKRREVKRVLKLEAQQKAQEERNRKALERSMQPPKKRTTRQVMFRSQPLRVKKRVDTEEITQQELDERRYLT